MKMNKEYRNLKIMLENNVKHTLMNDHIVITRGDDIIVAFPHEQGIQLYYKHIPTDYENEYIFDTGVKAFGKVQELLFF